MSDAFRPRDGVHLIRESMSLVMHEVIDAGATEVIGAATRRTGEPRGNAHSCTPPRPLATHGGDLELEIAERRTRSF